MCLKYRRYTPKSRAPARVKNCRSSKCDQLQPRIRNISQLIPNKAFNICSTAFIQHNVIHCKL